MEPHHQQTRRYEAGYQPRDYPDPGYGRGSEYGQDRGYDPYREPGRPEYREPGYPEQRDPGYREYRDPGYREYREPPAPRPRPQQRPRRQFAFGMFAGGVFAAAVVTALAAWFCAWIIQLINTRVAQTGRFGVWNPTTQDPYSFAVLAAMAAVLAGVLWYVLYLGTPSPELFFTWIVGLLTAAAVVTAVAVPSDLWTGIATAIEYLVIGVPILSMVRIVGARSVGYQ